MEQGASQTMDRLEGLLPAIAADQQLVITRTFDAPPELLFALWTQREHLLNWFAPRDGDRDFTTPSAEVDVRPGGEYRICIRSPDGVDYPMRGTYREVTPPRRLVFTHAWENTTAGPIGHETLITVTFEPEGAGTRLTFRQAFFTSVASRDSHRGGWSECLDRLAGYLPAVGMKA
jgi:uncharacterized protein YndB with AHSA1/START domain